MRFQARPVRRAGIVALWALLFASPTPAAPAAAQAGTVLDRVKAAGVLSCGVLLEPEDYGKTDVHGSLDELGRDICRGVAAAVLGSENKVTVTELTDERHGFEALQARRIDLLLGASPDPSSAAAFGLRFARPVFLDGASLLVRRDSGIGSAAALGGRKLCFIAGTEAEAVLDSTIEPLAPTLVRFPFEENGEMLAALITGHCDAVVDSASRLANDRAQFHGRKGDYVVLPERLTIDPMAPALRDDDPQWALVVSATIDALLAAERAGIARAGAAALRTTEDPALRRLGGSMPGVDPGSVDTGWAIRAIAAVGNFAELYDRDCGPSSGLGLERGANALWDRGGLMIPEPLR